MVSIDGNEIRPVSIMKNNSMKVKGIQDKINKVKEKKKKKKRVREKM